MVRSLARKGFPFVSLVVFLVGLAGCRWIQKGAKPNDLGAMPDITPTRIDYVDTDGFDALFEAALVSQDPVILLRTGRARPDWEGRLNAWIAAWNRGGSGRPRAARGQVGLPGVGLDKDALRELRLLVNDLLGRVEDVAQAGSTWWTDHRQRSRRIALLQPYSLRFHMDDGGRIDLVFFHGNYAPYYPRFVQTLTEAGEAQPAEWTRSLDCSRCSRRAGREIDGKLTSAAAGE